RLSSGSSVSRNLNCSNSPITVQRSQSPARFVVPSSSGLVAQKSCAVPLRSYVAKTVSSLAPNVDSRRWSVASLPSSSGYGTPGSNSAFSSEFSSQEQLCEALADLRMNSRFDSNDSYADDNQQQHIRPRSRSLTSPVCFDCDLNYDTALRSTVYKQRFPKAKLQMEERLSQFLEENSRLSGASIMEGCNVSMPGAYGSCVHPANSSSVNSSQLSSSQLSIDQATSRLISDGATRFIHHQIVEIASDCLAKSKDDLINCAYFCEMSQRLEDILNEAQEKTNADSFNYLSRIVRSLLMIVSRPARLLECLEFDPGEFYQLLEETEGAVREQLGAGNARVPDLPQYIISKLGLDRDPLVELDTENESYPTHNTSFDNNESRVHLWSSENKPPHEDDFELIRLISNGAYGAVYLVRHRETRQRFALKKMNKHTLVMRNQVDQVYAERDILTFTDNPFVVSFYGSFETRQHLCMLMEYVEGGDCAALLKNAGTLPYDVARLYIAETVLAIDYLHSYGIVHRDLKPDNLLITAMGHIKLTDFGLSKIGLMNRTTLVCEGYIDVADTQQFKDKQLCGTPEYIAPEVILRQGYGKPVDWWALGIILYEFLVGTVPFLGETPEELFANIIGEELEFPDGEEALPREAESMIALLLEKNPAQRLGTLGGAQQISAQAFFSNLDFRNLLRQKAEFVPQLESDEDTSFFDTRSDRYNHDADSGDEDSAPMFGSFSTASPRHSIIGYENLLNIFISITYLYMINIQGPHLRRFSAQRQNNVSTSSSGTIGTGCISTACCSTDSSMDASLFLTEISCHSPYSADSSRHTTSTPSPLPRFEFGALHSDYTEVVLRGGSVAKIGPSGSLQLVIPGSNAHVSQHSPGGGSISSVSSIDCSSPIAAPSSSTSVQDSSLLRTCQKPPIVIKKGPKGFGFTIRSVRVYLSEHSDYYTIEHLVTEVDKSSPAFEAGLRTDDVIVEVNSQPVSNLTHPQLMHRIVSYGNELSLKVTPMSSTTIREGAPRRTAGKLAKKKPKRPQRRVPMDKKSRKPSALLRRLSGKRGTNEIVPGSSLQKQTFMPRSASSQDGIQLGPLARKETMDATFSRFALAKNLFALRLMLQYLT
uniref:non-specific serine/threonine protein kinase n=1 Tax=Syphacia muris TaxID=451379 RepID=A0A0N5AG00_9BILA